MNHRLIKNNQSGVAIVEFALLSALLITIFFAIVSISIALYDNAILTDAARVGARAGIVSTTSAQGPASYPTCGSYVNITPSTTTAGIVAQCAAAQAVANAKLINFSGSASAPTITATSGGTCGTPPTQTCYLTVTITYPFVGILVFKSLNLTTSTTMYYE